MAALNFWLPEESFINNIKLKAILFSNRGLQGNIMAKNMKTSLGRQSRRGSFFHANLQFE